MIDCPYCKQTANPDNNCACGYPIAGSKEDKCKFLQTKRIVIKATTDQTDTHIRRSRYVLFGVAGLCLASGLMNVNADSRELTIRILLVIIFTVLGIFVRKSPLVVSIIGTCAIVLTGFFGLAGIICLIMMLILLYISISDMKANEKIDKIDSLINKIENDQM